MPEDSCMECFSLHRAGHRRPISTRSAPAFLVPRNRYYTQSICCSSSSTSCIHFHIPWNMFFWGGKVEDTFHVVTLSLLFPLQYVSNVKEEWTTGQLTPDMYRRIFSLWHNKFNSVSENQGQKGSWFHHLFLEHISSLSFRNANMQAIMSMLEANEVCNAVMVLVEMVDVFPRYKKHFDVLEAKIKALTEDSSVKRKRREGFRTLSLSPFSFFLSLFPWKNALTFSLCSLEAISSC